MAGLPRRENRYCTLVGIGIMAQIAWQVFCNIAVVTNTLPNTGISLPFFSSRRHQPYPAAGRDGRDDKHRPGGERARLERENLRAQREQREKKSPTTPSGSTPTWDIEHIQIRRKSPCVLIATGGTAGHINPALAIAGAIKKADPSAEIHFAGRKEGWNTARGPRRATPSTHIEITGFSAGSPRTTSSGTSSPLWNLALSGPESSGHDEGSAPRPRHRLRRLPAPARRCAAPPRKGIKTAIHEQNAFPGVTNKPLAPDVDIVFAAVPAAVESWAP